MLELRTRISRAGLDGREYRVIRPDRPASRMVMLDQSHWLSGYADRDAVKQLATLWSLAAVSPRSIVYLPMRQNTSAYEGRSLDLVLSYASLQLRPSRWKALRARLGDGASHTVRIPDPGTDESKLDYSRVTHREYRDLLSFDCAGDTLFVSGGRESFHRAAVHIRSVLPETIGHKRSDHLCVELASGTWQNPLTRRAAPGLLHFQYEPDGWPGPR
jgi:hypothetical protein